LNYYPFNVGDYAAHTAHLEPMEDLAYRRLLDQYYLREGPLPADIQATAKLVRMRSMAADVEAVLREFFTLTDEGWRHSRCDAEVEKMQDKQAKARASAEASVNARQAKRQAFAERSLKQGQTNVERTLHVLPTDVELPTPTPTPTPVLKERADTRRASRLPANWTLPPEWRDWSRATRPDLDPAKMADRFRDFWVAKAGRDGAKLDWAATWRNWVRAEAATTGRNNGQSPGAGDVWAGAV
jgi:uncharacterized protein YdaU (DUF1376 family)